MPTEIINLLRHVDKDATRSETDVMFDTSDRAMAERFGFRVRELMQSPTADVKHTARLAFSFATRALDTADRLAQLATTGRIH